MFWAIVGSIIASVAGVAIYIYYWHKGQFDDPEDVKYQMFRDDEENSR